VQQLKHSRDISLQLRSYEALALALQPPLMKHVLPVDASVEDIAVDADLRFLDGYVRQALDMGARQYPPGSLPLLHTDAPRIDTGRPARLSSQLPALWPLSGFPVVVQSLSGFPVIVQSPPRPFRDSRL
jgi:hypothetical protein